MAKKRQTKFDYAPTIEEIKARSFCITEGIKVYPIPLDNAGTRLRLERVIPAHIRADRRRNVKQGEKVYDGLKSEWVDAMFKIYVKLKNHYGKD